MPAKNTTLEIRHNPAARTTEMAIIEDGRPLASIAFTAEQLEKHIRVAINTLEKMTGVKKSTILMPGDPGFKLQ